MKVGVDARLLSRPLTGIGRYTHEMCRALHKHAKVTLHLYSPAPITADIGAMITKQKSWNNSLLRQLWAETYLPLWAMKDKLDVFWGPAHRLPRLLPKRVARVVTIHDLVWKIMPESMQPFTRMLEKINMPHAVRSADKIVADTHATAAAIKKEFLINDDKLSVIHLASSIEKYAFAANEFQQPYFLFVGTLEPRKNLTRLLSAYSQLPESIQSKAHLYIAGGKGWGEDNIASVVNSLGIGKYVKLLGYVSEEKLAELYAGCLFLAMPSLYEGFGLPLLEAMRYGKPVLTSNNSSMPEVAGDAGLFIDPFSEDTIRRGLATMISDELVRNTLASKAVANAERFSWDKSARCLIDVFEQAIAMRVT